MVRPGLARVSKLKFEICFQDFQPNPGMGRLQLDSGRGDIEIAGVFASVASMAASFAAEYKKQVVASKTGMDELPARIEWKWSDEIVSI